MHSIAKNNMKSFFNGTNLGSWICCLIYLFTMGDSKMCQAEPFFPHPPTPPPTFHYSQKKEKDFLDRHSLVVLNVTLSKRAWERRL